MFYSKQKAVRKLSLITTETDILKKGGGGVYFRGITWFSGGAEGGAEGGAKGAAEGAAEGAAKGGV